MLKASTLLVLLLMFARPVLAQDAFSSIRCGATISHTLMGKVMPRGRVVDIESRHRELGLKDVGASEISSSLTFASWAICGKEYGLLVDRREVVRDALLLSDHSRRRPRFLGSCEIAARKVPSTILAVLDNVAPLEGERHYAPADSTLLPAISAWRIDAERLRFVRISPANVRCPRNGISTVDGGP